MGDIEIAEQQRVAAQCSTLALCDPPDCVVVVNTSEAEIAKIVMSKTNKQTVKVASGGVHRTE